LIGCGQVAAEQHLPALMRMPEARVIAAADIEEGRLEHIAGRYAIPQRFTGYRALLHEASVDAVAILTPPESHGAIGQAALEAQKHVLIEKPLALQTKECDQLIETRKAAPGKVVVGFNLRWHRLVQEARRFITTGALGPIKAIRSAYTHNRQGDAAPPWKRTLRSGGGVTFHESIHHLDLWHFLLGSQVRQVMALHQSSEWFEDDTSVLSARLSNGILASLVSTYQTSPNSEIEVFGQSGRLVISFYRFDGLAFYPGSVYPGDVQDRLKKGLQTLRQLPAFLPVLRRGGDFADSFYRLWRHFLSCIRDDRDSECSLEDGKRAVQVALAAQESFLSEKPVHLS
jgi:predicted dehydrogenase